MTPATADLETIAGWLRSAGRVAALTGAGISTESGIPDFRGPHGVWTRNPQLERLSNIDYYMTDRSVRVQAWQERLKHPVWTAEPNTGHLALVELERKGRLHAVVTQNVDGLHRMAGTSPDILIEIHGTIHEVMCMACEERAPMEKALERVRRGEEDPPCRTCGGILKSATISFGQGLRAEELDRAFAAAAECDILLALGTTLVVYPIAGMADIALDYGGRLVIVNEEPTAYDGRAHASLSAPIGKVLSELAGMV